ncbi:MAG TPA: amidohydrolase family protein [Gaiellaceae bacterium]|nr:amidohydrolase family protein [Gaiellaceae bacterium]
MSERTVIRNATVITVDERLGDLWRGDVLIDGTRIAAVGPQLEAGDARELDATGMIVIPGFVDAHRHVWQAAIRGVAADFSFLQYFFTIHGLMTPVYRPEDVYVGNRLGIAEALNAGVTTTMDWCHVARSPDHTDEAIRALKESGARAVFAHAPPFGAGITKWAVESVLPHPDDIRRVRSEHFSSNSGLVTMAAALRGAEYSTMEVTRHDVGLARELGLFATYHVGCGTFGPKYKAITRMHAEGLVDPGSNWVHCNTIADEEFALLADAGATVTACPGEDTGSGEGPLPIGRALAAGLQPSFGVDIVTTTGGDMFTQMKAAFAYERARANDAAVMAGRDPERVDWTTADVLRSATLEGARACGLGDVVGSITPGKAADLVLLRPGINLAPVSHPVGSVVTAADLSNVDTVFVDGKVVKEDGRLVGTDLERLLSQAEESQRYLFEAAGWQIGEPVRPRNEPPPS